MKGADLLSALLPPVSYAPTAPKMQAIVRAEGAALDAAQRSADRVRASVTPFGAVELLPDWERVLALTAQGGYQERLSAVLAKLAEVGGLSIPYFVRLAERLGYTITIEEPQPFRAGTSRAGEALYISDIIWCWKVVVSGTAAGLRIFQFRAGASAAGERLLDFGDPVIEAVFDDLKPAHTFVYFAYQE